jgi:serine/threonine protein kinase
MGKESLHLDFEELQEAEIEPELEILSRLITFFGPVLPQLIMHINGNKWGNILMELSEVTAGDPGMWFKQWKEDSFPNLDPETKRLLSRMTKLDPTERPTVSQVLKDAWWSTTEDRAT